MYYEYETEEVFQTCLCAIDNGIEAQATVGCLQFVHAHFGTIIFESHVVVVKD
jgi:hypothetical protein